MTTPLATKGTRMAYNPLLEHDVIVIDTREVDSVTFNESLCHIAHRRGWPSSLLAAVRAATHVRLGRRTKALQWFSGDTPTDGHHVNALDLRLRDYIDWLESEPEKTVECEGRTYRYRDGRFQFRARNGEWHRSIHDVETCRALTPLLPEFQK